MHCKGCLWFPKNSLQKPIPLGGLYAQQLGTRHAGLCLDQCILQVLSSSENLNKKWSAETYWGREVRVSGIKWNSLKFWHEFLGPRNSSNNLKYSIWNYCRVSKSGLQEFSDFKSGNGDILRVDIPRAGDFCGATKHLADCSLVEISWSQSLPSIPYFQGNLHPLVTIFVHQNEKHPEDWFFIACLFHPWISTNHNYHKPSTPWPSAIMFHHVSSCFIAASHIPPSQSKALRSPGAQTFDRCSPRRYDPTALASRWPGAGEKRTTGWTPASPGTIWNRFPCLLIDFTVQSHEIIDFERWTLFKWFSANGHVNNFPPSLSRYRNFCGPLSFQQGIDQHLHGHCHCDHTQPHRFQAFRDKLHRLSQLHRFQICGFRTLQALCSCPRCSE